MYGLFPYFIKDLLFLYFECVCVCSCGIPMNSGARRHQRSWIALEQNLQAVVSCPTWVLGTKLKSSVIVAGTLSH